MVAPDTSKYTRTSYIRYARMMNNSSTYHNQTREFECVPAAWWLRSVFHLLTFSFHFAYRPKPGDSMQLIEELEEVILAVRIFASPLATAITPAAGRLAHLALLYAVAQLLASHKDAGAAWGA